MTAGRFPQLLMTKVLRPGCAPGLVDRPRLLGLATQLLSKQVVVIKAGSGFGKTTTAVGWAEYLEQSGNSVAWLSLDPEDDEPTRFFFYLSHALRRGCDRQVGGAAINLIADVSLIPLNTIVSALVNDLAEIENEVYLFLDDYHCISDAEIHRAMSFLLKYVSTGFHLVLTSRIEPALPLAGLRAQNRLLEIDTSAMRFDLDETRKFVDQERLGTLSISERETLHAKTEGWPAVLRIIAATFSRSEQDFAQYVQGLSGALRPISAYFGELLDGLPDELVRFMLRTAILDRLSAPLCNAVTGAVLSQALLDSIADRQLFLIPLDREKRWYRYHRLLADYLAEEAETQFGDKLPELHRRAAQWFAANELWTDAVKHAIAAGNVEQASTWIKNCAMTLVKKGDHLTLLSWQRLFPSALMQRQIQVKLAIAWGMALAMRFADALQLVDQAEQGFSNEVDADVLRYECQTIRSIVAGLQDDSQKALTLAEEGLKSTDTWTANVASNAARFGRWKAGDFAGFYAVPWIPFPEEEEKRNGFASVHRLCLQGLVEIDHLRLDLAERYYLEAMRQAEQCVGANSVAAALPSSLLAQLRYEQSRFQEAEALVVNRLSLVNAAGTIQCALSAYISLVRIAAWRLNIERAYALLEQAESLGHTRKWGRLTAAVLLERLRLYLSEGRPSEADACLARLTCLTAEYPTRTRCAWAEIGGYEALGRAHVALAHNHAQEAVTLLKGLRQEAEAARNNHLALRVATQISVALLAANEPDKAAATFGTALSAAAQSGIHQMILDQGPEIGALLTRFRDGVPRTGHFREILHYASTLLARWRELHQVDPTTRAASAVMETLSPRERGILQLIGQGQSNKEIARYLGITPETVKSHVRNIFIKLAVEKRAQAVSRAQGLGLLRADTTADRDKVESPEAHPAVP